MTYFTDMEVEFAPVPPPLPPKSPTTKKQQQVASQQRPNSTQSHPNYPKVSLQQPETSDGGESRVAIVPESPPVVAVPKPPQRSISLLEADYQNSSIVAAANTATAVDSCTHQQLPRPRSACNLVQQQPKAESSISRWESTPNNGLVQKNVATNGPVHSPPPNVYVNISGGGSVQVDPTRAMASSVAIHPPPQLASAGVANAFDGATVRHVHEVHHHHHFHHGPRLTTTSNPFLLGSASTNPFLSGFALSGYGPGNAFSSSQQVPDPFAAAAAPLAAAFRPSFPDLRAILRRNREELQVSGWYHGRKSMDEANQLLQGTTAGTFLVRDSSAPDCMFALTFQQDAKRFPDRCANSVRIRFFESTGKFQLDPSNNCKRSQLPEFNSVVELIEFYVKSRCPSTNVLLDEVTGVHYPICLKRPLGTTRAPASLQHLARLSVHRSIGKWQATGYRQRNLQSIDQLGLPNEIRDDLSNYPYTI